MVKFNTKLCLLLFLIIVISLYFSIKYKTEKFDLNIEVKESSLLGKGERGLFAKKNYKKGEIIEVCPTLSMNPTNIPKSNILFDHFFKGNNNNSLLSLGYCSIINHSKDKQNCSWKVSNNNDITMYALRDIKSGEELYSNYGNNYWKNKNNQK